MRAIRRRLVVRVLCCGAAAWLAVAPSGAARAEGGQPVPQVTVAPPLARRIALWDEYTGRFEAVQRVEVRPRVSGYIDQIHFADGAIVAKGDVLFTIDPRPYEIAVEQARADVTRNRAQCSRRLSISRGRRSS